jgi:hypothetical protein
MIPITVDDIADMGLNATDKLIELGYVQDCTDTDKEDEFEVQDAIREAITNVLNRKGYKLKNS